MSMTKPKMSNRAYDITKYAVQIVLPACGTLYFALAGLWELPNAEQVVGTIVAITTFLGVLLGLSSASYNASDDAYDGEMVLEPDVENQVTNLNFTMKPEALNNKKRVTFKVQRPNQ